MASSRIYNLYNEIDEIVGDIDKYADGAFNVATKEAAKIAVKELKKRSLKISDTAFIKRYAAGWTFKEQKYKEAQKYFSELNAEGKCEDSPIIITPIGKNCKVNYGNQINQIDKISEEDKTRLHNAH